MDLKYTRYTASDIITSNLLGVFVSNYIMEIFVYNKFVIFSQMTLCFYLVYGQIKVPAS